MVDLFFVGKAQIGDYQVTIDDVHHPSDSKHIACKNLNEDKYRVRLVRIDEDVHYIVDPLTEFEGWQHNFEQLLFPWNWDPKKSYGVREVFSKKDVINILIKIIK